MTGLNTPTGRRQPDGYLQVLPRISTVDEQVAREQDLNP